MGIHSHSKASYSLYVSGWKKPFGHGMNSVDESASLISLTEIIFSSNLWVLWQKKGLISEDIVNGIPFALERLKNGWLIK